MKITAKTLQQQTIELEIEPERSVIELKEEISKKLGGDYNVERQKLICAGVVLDNERTLASYNITEDQLIVVMLLRDTSIMEQADNNEDMIATNQNSREPVPVTASPEDELTQIISDSLPSQVPSESAFLTGGDYKQALDTFVEMGFEREMAEHAMTASFNNPERAFEYLMNGIPDDVEIDSQPGQHVSQEVTSETVNQVLQLLRQNPALLQATLEQMGVTNPEILQQIRSNPDAFFNLMQHTSDGQSGGNEASVTPQDLITPERLSEFRESINAGMLQNSGRGSEVGEPQAATGNAPPANNQTANAVRALQQNLNQSDRAAIDRLKAMGFDETMALQAYIAFDKNESLAANFLASNNEDN